MLEAVIVLMVAAGSYRLALGYLVERDVQTLIAWEIEPAVMFACGYGFVHPGGESVERQRFITRRRGSISCADFAWGGAPTPAIGIALNNRYSIYGAGYAMEWAGVSWHALDGYLSFLYALSMTALYGLCRQMAGRVLAVAGVIVMACSTLLAEIVVLRDFVKLPCFAVLWLLLAWMIRRGLAAGPRGILLPMAVGGAGVGLGIGLRMDGLILAPAFVAIGTLAIPGFTRVDLKLKASAVGLFVLFFLATGIPILRSMAGGSNSAHVIVLGLLRDFDPGLGIESAPYDLGAHYSDGFGYTLIASHGLLKQGARLPILLGSPEYDRIGNRLIAAVVRQFPADMLARAMSATLQVFRYQFDWRIRDGAEKLHTFQASPVIRTIMTWRTRALAPFEGRELWLALGVLALAAAFEWRLGVIGLGLIMYFGGYSMLQYARRHAFHLDVIPLLLVVLAVQLPAELLWSIASAYRQGASVGLARLRQHGRQLAIGLMALIVAVAAAAGIGAAARWWQQRSVSQLIEATLESRWVAVEPTEEPLSASIIENGAPVYPWQAVYQSDPERWKTATLLRVPGVVPAGTEAAAAPDLRHQYFKLAITAACDAIEITIVPSYHAATHSYDHEYIRSFVVPVSHAATSFLLVPAYYHLGPTWNRLDGFAVAAAERRCIAGIFRAEDPSQLPLPVLTAVLPSDWRDRPLYQRVQAVPRTTIIGTPISPPRPRAGTQLSGWRRDLDAPLEHRAPALELWNASPGVKLSQRAGMEYVVATDTPSEYQLVSPALEVPARHLIAIQVVGAMVKGSICVGVLDGAERRWLLAPNPGEHGLVAESRDFTRIRLVFSNCDAPSSEFAVRAISYQAFPIE